MRRMLPDMLLTAALGLSSSACPVDDEPDPGGEPSTSSDGSGSGDAGTTGETSPDPDTGTAETGEPAAWVEAGWGLTEWNAFDGVLPLVVGPQGLAMFSVPLRGRGFRNPTLPDYDDPELPIVQAWVDVEGHAESPGGHLAEVVDQPGLFYPSFEEPGLLEATAVWLLIPDAVDPSTLVGTEAHLHVELLDVDGLELVDDRVLSIGEVPPEPDGP